MIEIRFNDTWYEIPYDDETLGLNFTIDSAFDHGYFESTPLGASAGLDFSRRIPRDLLVRITIDNKVWYFKTGETYAEKISYGIPLYLHKVSLISLAKDLVYKTLENMTLTQPKGDFGQYSHMVSKLPLDTTLRSLQVSVKSTYDFPCYEIEPTLTAVTMSNTINTNTTLFDNMEIKVLDTYQISLSMTGYSVIPYEQEMGYKLKYNGAVIYEESFDVAPSTAGFTIIPTEFKKAINLTVTPAMVGVYTIEMWNVDEISNGIGITDLSFSITKQDVLEKPVRTYAQLVDKMLRNTDYVLSPKSRIRLNITAPEGKWEGYTVYDALQKIGGELRALVRVGDEVLKRAWYVTASSLTYIEGESITEFNPYEYDVDTILKIGSKYYINRETDVYVRYVDFEFFDNPSVFEPIGEIYRSEQAELEDYVSSLELNTSNVVKPLRYSPFKNGWMGLRNIDGIGQMTTANIGYQTEDDIERVISVKVKGLESENVDETVIYTVNDVTDITSRVLEKRQWDTLPSESNYNYVGKQILNKNNTLYYIQGDDKLYGMSYTGEHDALLLGTANVVRALYETILAVRSVESGELITRNGTQAQDDPATDGSLNGDLAIQLQVTYSNITESRARVYKDDLSGFETDRTKYVNESSNINESASIGSFAQQLVNRLGGTKISVSGVADDLSDIAELGDIDSDGRVYTGVHIKPATKIEWEYLLVQDYNVISSYIGVNSRHRVEEIPSSNVTNRTLRYQSRFVFTETQQSYSTRLISAERILGAITGLTDDGINYGYLECNLSDGTQRKIHLSVDSDSKGKTIELKWKLKDNYSAGLKRYSITVGSNTLWINSDVPYTDYYGKVNDIWFGLYFGTLGAIDVDDYPEATISDGDDAFVILSDDIDKDAGEIIHGLVEIPILSENPKIRVYDGFAKWNTLVTGTERIKCAGLLYTPIKNATRIDLSRAIDVTATTMATDGVLNVSFTPSQAIKGIAFYNEDTLEFLLAYINDFTAMAQSVNMYYRVDDIGNGGQNVAAFVSLILQMDGLISTSNHDQDELIGDIHYYTLANTTEFIILYGLANVNYELSGSINYGTTFEDEISGDIHYYVMADDGLSIMLYGSASVHYIPQGMISSSESMQDSLSGGLEYTVTSSYSISYPDSFTVTFKDFDGTTLKTVTNVAYEGYAAPPNTNPTRTGYTFAGWNSSAYQVVTQNETITATYTANTYTVYFSANGGSTVSNKTVTFGNTYGTLATPTQSGWTFLGWYTSSSYTTQVISATTVTTANNHTLYAHWVRYYWSSGGTQPVGGNSCSSPSDVGNIVCDTGVVSCSWNPIGISYTSTTDESENVSASCMSVPAKTVCTLISPPSYGWVAGGSSLTPSQLCSTANHVGNVRGEVVSCSWEIYDGPYLSTIDDSTYPQCSGGETRKSCTKEPGDMFWTCYMEEGKNTYGNFETCQLVSQAEYQCTDYEAEREFGYVSCSKCEVTYK